MSWIASHLLQFIFQQVALMGKIVLKRNCTKLPYKVIRDKWSWLTYCLKILTMLVKYFLPPNLSYRKESFQSKLTIASGACKYIVMIHSRIKLGTNATFWGNSLRFYDWLWQQTTFMVENGKRKENHFISFYPHT